MKKRLLLFKLLFFYLLIADAQNLLRNGDFENYYQLPQEFSQAELCKYVFNPSPDRPLGTGQATPDYFSNLSFLPNSEKINYSTAYSNYGFLGFFGFGAQIDYREYVQLSFSNPLINEVEYMVRIFVSNGNFFPSKNRTDFPTASNTFQVAFTEDTVSQYLSRPLYLPPAFSIDTLFYSEEWVEVEFTYKAKGGERFITFGNFKHKENIQFKRVIEKEDAFFYFETAYFFIDDVSVIPQNTFPLSTNEDTLIICRGDTAVLQVEGDSLVQWYQLPERTLVAENKTEVEVSPSNNTVYVAKGRTDSARFYVFVNDTPSVRYNDTTICLGKEIYIPEQTYNYDSIFIQPATENNNITATGQYYLTAYKQDCMKEKEINVKIEDCEVAIDYPNIFTPNRDGKNDSFVPIIYKGIEEAELKIYNRWGGLVYNTKKPLSGWEAFSVSDGVYYWYCRYTDRNQNMGELKGWVQLIR